MTVLKFREEKTFVLVKPDGVKRGLIGEIISLIEQRGLKIIALEMFRPTAEEMDKHYPKDKTWINRLGEKTLKTYNQYNVDPLKELGTAEPHEIGQMIRRWLIEYMTSGPLVKIVVQGVHAVDMVRKLAGDTIPALAEMGTIRGDFSVDSPSIANTEKRAVHNILHASETPQEAEHEINHWFKKEQTYSYRRVEEDLTI